MPPRLDCVSNAVIPPLVATVDGAVVPPLATVDGAAVPPLAYVEGTVWPPESVRVEGMPPVPDVAPKPPVLDAPATPPLRDPDPPVEPPEVVDSQAQTVSIAMAAHAVALQSHRTIGFPLVENTLL